MYIFNFSLYIFNFPLYIFREFIKLSYESRLIMDGVMTPELFFMPHGKSAFHYHKILYNKFPDKAIY